MKRQLLTLALAAALCSAALAETKTAVFQTTIHCTSCEQRIKKNLRFEKGVKRIDVHLGDKLVAITYDDTKIGVDQLRSGIEKLGYKATLLPPADAKGKDGGK